MNLLTDPWIPVRAEGGSGAFRLLTYQELLCEADDGKSPGWQISLPRDDLELACLQLLVCMTQVIFLPADINGLRARIKTPLTEHEFRAGVGFYRDWFDLDHPTQPFMQSRGVKAAEDTPIQKLLIGLPEGNNHAFFNEAGEVQHLSAPLAAIALFNQASNCPSFGGGGDGGFKGSLRGNAPITTLVWGDTLRNTIWRNVLTRDSVKAHGITMPAREADLPTWVQPIVRSSTMYAHTIGLLRGLFWQPARVELVKAPQPAPCGVLAGELVEGYSVFLKEPFGYSLEGLWPHPHGIQHMTEKKGVEKCWFSSFTTTAPAWTQLAEFTMPKRLQDKHVQSGTTPAGPVIQAPKLDRHNTLTLLVGGYRTKQAAVLERRHELIGLRQSWLDEEGYLPDLLDIAMKAKKILCDNLINVSTGKAVAVLFPKQRKTKKKKIHLKGVGVPLHKADKDKPSIGERLFYARTEGLIFDTFSTDLALDQWLDIQKKFTQQLQNCCLKIFEEVTAPYTNKVEWMPVIAWAKRNLENELADLNQGMEEAKL